MATSQTPFQPLLNILLPLLFLPRLPHLIFLPSSPLLDPACTATCPPRSCPPSTAAPRAPRPSPATLSSATWTAWRSTSTASGKGRQRRTGEEGFRKAWRGCQRRLFTLHCNMKATHIGKGWKVIPEEGRKNDEDYETKWDKRRVTRDAFYMRREGVRGFSTATYWQYKIIDLLRVCH